MTTYRVYIHVEGEKADGEFVEVDLDFGPSFETDSQEWAVHVADRLHRYADIIAKVDEGWQPYSDAVAEAMKVAEWRSATGISREDS